jgi:hypothetical protein
VKATEDQAAWPPLQPEDLPLLAASDACYTATLDPGREDLPVILKAAAILWLEGSYKHMTDEEATALAIQAGMSRNTNKLWQFPGRPTTISLDIIKHFLVIPPEDIPLLLLSGEYDRMPNATQLLQARLEGRIP